MYYQQIMQWIYSEVPIRCVYSGLPKSIKRAWLYESTESDSNKFDLVRIFHYFPFKYLAFDNTIELQSKMSVDSIYLPLSSVYS